MLNRCEEIDNLAIGVENRDLVGKSANEEQTSKIKICYSNQHEITIWKLKIR